MPRCAECCRLDFLMWIRNHSRFVYSGFGTTRVGTRMIVHGTHARSNRSGCVYGMIAGWQNAMQGWEPRLCARGRAGLGRRARCAWCWRSRGARGRSRRWSWGCGMCWGSCKTDCNCIAAAFGWGSSLGRWAGRVRRWWAGESVQLWTRACAAICWASCGSGGTCWGSCAGIAGKRAKWSVGGVGGRRSARLAVRDARGVCGSRVRSAGREEPRGGEPQRSRRTLARHVPPSRLFTVRFLYT
jgi:hypothetical protein